MKFHVKGNLRRCYTRKLRTTFLAKKVRKIYKKKLFLNFILSILRLNKTPDKKRVSELFLYNFCIKTHVGFLTLKVHSKTVADNILIFIIIIFQRKQDLAFHVNHLPSR